MFTRMIVCEALSDENVHNIVSHMQEHVRHIPNVIDHSILAEEGGRMVILTLDWNNREACLEHHASRLNRKFVVDTQNLLIGGYVVKVFKNFAERRCP